jgi:acid phosphatase type 7
MRVIALAVVAILSATAACTRAKPGLLIGAGDIARCDADLDDRTAVMVEQAIDEAKTAKRSVVVVTMGDNVYPRGTPTEFATCYGPTWGRAAILSLTRPSPGNHEYLTPGAEGYWGYFGERAGPRGLGYYTYTSSGWRLFALNSELTGDTATTQMEWLKRELESARSTRCVLAYFHRPIYSSSRGVQRRMQSVWEVLDAAGADVILAGHDHTYERFAKQRADGTRDDVQGIRQFVVGTGGASLYPFTNADSVKHSEYKQNDKSGVLTMTLKKRGYSWAFTDVDGVVRDQGEDQCR